MSENNNLCPKCRSEMKWGWVIIELTENERHMLIQEVLKSKIDNETALPISICRNCGFSSQNGLPNNFNILFWKNLKPKT